MYDEEGPEAERKRAQCPHRRVVATGPDEGFCRDCGARLEVRVEHP